MFSLAMATSRHSNTLAAQGGHLEDRDSRTTVEEPQASSSSRPRPPQYGYHNTFHLHASPHPGSPDPPPSYETAITGSRAAVSSGPDVLPQYDCTIAITGQLGVKCELSSPFMLTPPHASEWQEVYVELSGTQLRLYKLKATLGRRLTGGAKQARSGKLIKAYSMQHAEVGIAADVKKGDLIPKSAFGRLIPPAARQKAYETDPHLFETVREHNIRLRVETEQFLLCAQSQTEMLDWVELLAAAIDIAMPLEDRSEPRYRSLPRRARRQREAEGRRSTDDALSNIESQQNLVRQQERLFRELYPHLAADHDQQRQREVSAARAVEGLSDRSAVRVDEDGDPDAEDLDRADALIPTTYFTESSSELATEASTEEQQRNAHLEPAQTQQSSAINSADEVTQSSQRAAVDSVSESHSDALSAETRRSSFSSDRHLDVKPPRRPTPQLTPAAALRYRRRCAPVLLASSPRASHVIVAPILTTIPKPSSAEVCGQALRRVKVDFRKQRLVPFEQSPPKYDAHGFTERRHVAFAERTTLNVSRPRIERGDTAMTFMSTVSTATTIAEDGENTHGDDTLSSIGSTDVERASPTQSPSVIEDQHPTEQSASTEHSQDSSGEIAAAPVAPEMSREVSKASSVDRSGSPSPTSTADLALTKATTNDSVDLSQALAKKTRILRFHTRLRSQKTADARQETQLGPDPSRSPVGNKAASEIAAFATMMF